jgi:hypothetical protein
MTTDQLEALKQAANDETRFPINAGRAAKVSSDQTSDGGDPATPQESNVRKTLVTGFIIGLAAAVVELLLIGLGELEAAVGVFCVVVILHVLSFQLDTALNALVKFLHRTK